MRKVAGVLFDLDGTLIDTYNVILTSMRYTMSTVLGKDMTDDELMGMVGTPLDSQMVKFADGDVALGAKLARVYREHNEGVHDAMVRTFSGMPEVLACLHDSGMPMGVVTSKRHAIAMRGVRACGLDPYLDFLIGSDDFPVHKPEPGPVLEGCRLLGLDPECVAYVGDSPFDILAGNAAKCSTVAVTWGVFGADELRACEPNAFCTSVSELCDVLLGA